MSLLVMAGLFGLYWIGTSVVNGIRLDAKAQLIKAMDSVSTDAKVRMVPLLRERDSLNGVVDTLSKTTQQRIDSLRALIGDRRELFRSLPLRLCLSIRQQFPTETRLSQNS